MFIEIGYFALCLACVLALYAFTASILSLLKFNRALIQTARNTIVACFACILLSCLSLWNAIIYHDFSIQYVFAHSAVDMPPFYLFTSFWSALEGSHLLWTLLLSTVCAIFVLSVKKDQGLNYLPAVCLAFSVCLIFMLFLNVTISRPFDRAIPTNHNGLGMNALLQNPYMAIHPPMLFLGYSLLVVPFALGFAALFKGTITPFWRMMVRRFTLMAWTVLTIAIFLGGKWAYVVLGWGGYWGWDPVENASFMPWLATTAFLHTLLIYERTQRLPRLAVFLGMFAFVLTFFGTFLTRSGVISSVHSFAESSIGPAYLIWIVLLCVVTLGLVFSRGMRLQSTQTVEERLQFSKEAVLFFTNYFLLFLLAIVFFGTVSPLIVEAISGAKISIQQPFYNAFAPWIGLILVSILGIGNLAKWKAARLQNPWLSIFVPLCASVCVTLGFYFVKHFDLKTAFIYCLVIWTLFVLIADFIYRLKHLQWNASTFLLHNRSYLGALIIHIGFLTAILGFSGYSRDISQETTLALGQSTEFNGFILTNRGLTFQEFYNEKKVTAHIEIRNAINRNAQLSSRSLTSESIPLFTAEPARTKFTNNEQWFNEVGLYSTLWFDLYFVLISFDNQNQNVVLKMNYNPMVKFVWTSVAVMTVGAFTALSARFTSPLQQLRQRRKSKLHRMLSSFLVFFIILLTFFALSGVVSAEEATPKVQIEDVGKELRCPTCLGMSIMESETPQSVAMRGEVARLVSEGKNKQEIKTYFKDHYGSWILREPDSSTTLGQLLWLIPILGFIIGPFWILWRFKK